jgi:hypothetical protein
MVSHSVSAQVLFVAKLTSMSVALDYHLFRPTRQAFIIHALPNFVQDNARVLEGSIISGQTIQVRSVGELPPTSAKQGSGLSAGLPHSQLGKSVVLSGMVFREALSVAVELTRDFELADIQLPVENIPP